VTAAPALVLNCPAEQAFCQTSGNSYVIPDLIISGGCNSSNILYEVSGATNRSGTGANASGIYNIGVSTIKWTVTDGCTISTCTTTVTINAFPNISQPQPVTQCNKYILPTLPVGAEYYSGPNGTGVVISAGSEIINTQTVYIHASSGTVPACVVDYPLMITINPNVTGDTTAVICQGQLPYKWYENTLNAAGTATNTVVSAAGCDSVVTLHLTVNPNVTGDTTAVICQGQLPYKWYENTLNAAGTATHTFVSAAGCDSVVTLHLTVKI
jgi:hypothetical protein